MEREAKAEDGEGELQGEGAGSDRHAGGDQPRTRPLSLLPKPLPASAPDAPGEAPDAVSDGRDVGLVEADKAAGKSGDEEPRPLKEEEIFAILNHKPQSGSEISFPLPCPPLRLDNPPLSAPSARHLFSPW